MASVSLRGVEKEYTAGEPVLHDCNLDIKDHEFIVLVGPSGSGKTTLLRIIAGLEHVSRGDVHFGDVRVNDIDVGDRDIAMVFQNYGLYPHMSVYKNMAFGLRRRKVAKPEIDRRVRDAAELLGMADYLERRPRQLSGGQRQRVALGRAIVRDPAVFLLDEPLSNLDAHLRVQMRAEILRVHRSVTATAVYVTHDQVEALTMGDRIAVMNEGVIQQVGTPDELYDRPVNRFVAGFIGTPSMGFLTCRVSLNGGPPELRREGVRIPLPPDRVAALDGVRDGEVLVGIRPERLELVAPEAAGERSTVQGVVTVVEPLGSDQHLLVDVGGETITARVSRDHRVQVAERVTLATDGAHVHLFDRESGARR
jgi:multiple sugar transport system ATP-binding protein